MSVRCPKKVFKGNSSTGHAQFELEIVSGVHKSPWPSFDYRPLLFTLYCSVEESPLNTPICLFFCYSSEPCLMISDKQTSLPKRYTVALKLKK